MKLVCCFSICMIFEIYLLNFVHVNRKICLQCLVHVNCKISLCNIDYNQIIEELILFTFFFPPHRHGTKHIGYIRSKLSSLVAQILCRFYYKNYVIPSCYFYTSYLQIVLNFDVTFQYRVWGLDQTLKHNLVFLLFIKKKFIVINGCNFFKCLKRQYFTF